MNIQFPDSDQHLAAARRGVVNRIHRIRRKRSLVVAGVVVLAGVVGTGGTLVVAQVSQRAAATGVVCYAHDDLGSLNGTVAQADATNAATGQRISAPNPDKAELCGLVWRSGLKAAAANGGRWPNIDPNTSTLPVPALAYCLLSDGMTGGFPIEAPSTTPAQVCDRLGLALDTGIAQ